MKDKYAFVLKSIKKNTTISKSLDSLRHKTFIVVGGTRGIGFNIAEKLAASDAYVSILGKTIRPHPKLENTIYTAAEVIKEKVQKATCMAIPFDVRNRDPKHLDFVFNETEDVFGKVNGIVLNASALCLNNTLNQTEKEIDLMSAVNINGTYMLGQKFLQRMNDRKGHILIIAPPIDMLYNDDWWTNHFYYSMSKFNMSLMSKFWDKEFPNISVNTLWPRTTIDTAPVRNLLGGKKMSNISRKSDIMGDAAKHILASDPLLCTGNNFIDDEVLASLDIDVEGYKVKKEVNEKDLMPDFFC